MLRQFLKLVSLCVETKEERYNCVYVWNKVCFLVCMCVCMKSLKRYEGLRETYLRTFEKRCLWIIYEYFWLYCEYMWCVVLCVTDKLLCPRYDIQWWGSISRVLGSVKSHLTWSGSTYYGLIYGSNECRKIVSIQ